MPPAGRARPLRTAMPLVRALTVSNGGGGLLCIDGYGLDPLVRATQDFTVSAGTCRPQTPEEMAARRIALLQHVTAALGATMTPAQVAELIGLDVIRSKCPHFAGWLTRLEGLGAGHSAPLSGGPASAGG